MRVCHITLALCSFVVVDKQASTFSSNIRLALLDRSGTGFFLVYNDRRDGVRS